MLNRRGNLKALALASALVAGHKDKPLTNDQLSSGFGQLE